MLSDYLQRLIKSHALQTTTQECCGIIISPKRGDTFAIACKNIAIDKTKRFEIAPIEYLNACSMGEVIGFYHSHIGDNNKLSLVDKHYSEVFQLPIILYSIKSDSFDVYYPNKSLLPYIGLDFEIGSADCFTLVKEYFQKEHNHIINNYHRDNNWYEINPTLIEDSFEKEGFVKVNNLKQDDLILLSLKSGRAASHLAIYVGGNKILHHPRDRYSCLEDYTNSLMSRTVHILRLKNLCS